MSRAVAVALLVLLPAVARADVAVPGFHSTHKDLILRFDNGEGYAFFLVTHIGEMERIPLAPGQEARIDGRRWQRHRFAKIVAVPDSLLRTLDGQAPSPEWLAGQKAGVLHSEYIDFRSNLPFFDSREKVVRTYRVELTPADVRLVLVEENADNVKAGWLVAGLALAAGVVGLWVWAVWRVSRPRAA